MNEKPLSCTIKNPVPVVPDLKAGFQTGCKIVDITFPSIVNPETSEDLEVGEIRFQNFYVAFLTIKVKIKLTEQTPREGPNDHGWRMAIRRFKLMPDPHAETGAQDTFSFTKKQFACDLTNVVSMRLILQQPSPIWKDFKLEEIKLFRASNGPRAPPLPTWVMEDEKGKIGKKEIEEMKKNPRWSKCPLSNSEVNAAIAELGVPDLDVLSSGLQQLWALAEEASANQSEALLGRYEVDGCYDINLLAYS